MRARASTAAAMLVELRPSAIRLGRGLPLFPHAPLSPGSLLPFPRFPPPLPRMPHTTTATSPPTACAPIAGRGHRPLLDIGGAGRRRREALGRLLARSRHAGSTKCSPPATSHVAELGTPRVPPCGAAAARAGAGRLGAGRRGGGARHTGGGESCQHPGPNTLVNSRPGKEARRKKNTSGRRARGTGNIAPVQAQKMALRVPGGVAEGTVRAGCEIGAVRSVPRPGGCEVRTLLSSSLQRIRPRGSPVASCAHVLRPNARGGHWEPWKEVKR